MIVELIANGVCAFAGTVAFTVLFNVPRHFTSDVELQVRQAGVCI